MATTDTYQTETDRLTTELATDGGEPVVEIDVPTAESDGDHYHAPGTPCGRHLTRRSHMAAFALRERELEPCANCVANHGLDDVVATLDALGGDADPELVTDGGREVVEIPLTLHYDGTGLFLWVTDDDVPQSHIDGVTMGEGGIEHLEREVFARLPEVSLCAAEKNLLTEQERSARGRSAPQVATVEYYPDDHETGGVALSFDRDAYVTLFPTERAGDTPTLLADGGREVVSVEFRSSPTIEALLNAAQADPVTPAGLTTAVTHETITATATPEAFRWLHEWLDARASVRDASPRYAADIAAGMADRIFNDVAGVETRAPTAEERIVTDGGHANAVLEQLKQAERDGDLPEELAAKHDLDGDDEEEGDDVE